MIQRFKRRLSFLLVAWAVLPGLVTAQVPPPAAQKFGQEISRKFTMPGSSNLPVQLVLCAPGEPCRVFSAGQWSEYHDGGWKSLPALTPSSRDKFTLPGPMGKGVQVELPWPEIRQVLRCGESNVLVTSRQIYSATADSLHNLAWPEGISPNQAAAAPNGALYVACKRGLRRRISGGWETIPIADQYGRSWTDVDIRGVTVDTAGHLWIAAKAGAGCLTAEGWKFYEGKDGLPWNDFTGMAAGPGGEVWFATHLGAIRFEAGQWHYRQGPLWLPDDDVQSVAVDSHGGAWFATAKGIGFIGKNPMSLEEKAAYYEEEIQRYIKRTPFGFVAEAALRTPGCRASAFPQDSDNDGLWTAMYGAGECFAYAATKDSKAKERARAAFEALRFLQKVTQGGSPAPPKGYIARTIRPVEWPDPNIGRLAGDKEEQKRDKLWKVYEPRWPKSADGKWYWKSDTSSDELDGHYFFYPLYFDFCADTPEERARVQEVVRDITDHLLTHDFNLVDHDGRPTRWGIYSPNYLNRDPYWWQERGLKSLSMLSYLAVAEHITGDPKYAKASRELIDRHGYAQNAMHPKVQHGPGSGNQSDDEMAFMCFYGLLRCSKDPELKALIRFSLFRYWVNEEPEMNPFFNFVSASQNSSESAANPWGSYSVAPWPGWHADSMATLYGFPLDRLAWSHRNSHRLDIVPLPRVRSSDIYDADPPRERGSRVNGKVLPVENRHFNHWNTDPWRLDYGGNGGELAAGTVFLLPYYMGLYHRYIEHPGN